jgi:phage gp29-like protein
MKQSILSQLIDNYRSSLNPLRGLTINYAVRMLEEGQRGAYADLQWLFKFVEKRDPTLRGVKRRLSSSLLKLDWNIKIVDTLPEGQKKLAEAQQLALRAEYEKIKNLRQALRHLALAEFRGFAHLEKHWEPDGQGGLEIQRLEPVPQWHFVRDGIYGDWQFNAKSTSGTVRGEPIDPANFLVREVEDPIDEIALIAFVRKNMSQKDWDGFIENFGIPYLFLIMPKMSQDDDAADFQAVANQIASNSRGVLPNGSDVKTADSGIKGGNNPFKDHIGYQDEQIVLAGTSGLLTMLSMPQGIGSGSSDEHGDTFEEIALAQAMDISEIFQAQFDADMLDRLFPGQPHLVYFELAAKDQEDINGLFDNAVKAQQAGLAVDAEEMSEKTGLKLTRGGAELPTSNLEQPTSNTKSPEAEELAAEVKNRNKVASSHPSPAGLQFLQAARAKDAARLVELIDALEAADTPEDYASALADLETELSTRQIDPANSEYARALEAVLGSAVVEGAQSALSPNATERPSRA